MEKIMTDINFRARKVSALTMVSVLSTNEDFHNGFLDAKAGKPIPAFSSANYERGRHFYAWYTTKSFPRAVWKKNIMAKTVQERLLLAFREGVII
jgi:hypothetical protein